MRLWLKLAILAAGKTQRQIAAESLQISENRLSEIVRGWVMPNDDEKAVLAQVLGEPMDLLFEEPHRVESPDRVRRPIRWRPATSRMTRRTRTP